VKVAKNWTELDRPKICVN